MVACATEFNRVRKQIVREGENTARDGVRNICLLNIVDKLHNLCKYYEENKKNCQKVVRMMKEASREEMSQHIQKMTEGAEKEMKFNMQASDAAFAEKSRARKEEVRCFINLPNKLLGGEVQRCSGRLRKTRLGSRTKPSFKSGPCIGKLVKKCRISSYHSKVRS